MLYHWFLSYGSIATNTILGYLSGNELPPTAIPLYPHINTIFPHEILQYYSIIHDYHIDDYTKKN
jgi:hypothetical protein